MYYNSTASASTEKSPHEIVYGSTLKMPTENLLQENMAGTPELLLPSVEHHLARLRQIHTAVITNLKQARIRQKEYADRHRRPLEFNLGDYVLLSTRNLQIQGV